MQIYAQAVWAHSISKHMQLITDSILIFLHTTCPVPTGQGRPKSQSDPWKAACSCRLTAASDVTATTGSSGADDLWSSHFAPHIDEPQAADQVGVDERHHQMLSHSHERLCKRAHIYTQAQAWSPAEFTPMLVTAAVHNGEGTTWRVPDFLLCFHGSTGSLLDPDSRRCIKFVAREERSGSSEATKHAHTHTLTQTWSEDRGMLEKAKETCGLTHLLIFSPFFSPSCSNQGTAPAFSDVTQPVSAAESSSRPAEDEQGGEEEGGEKEKERGGRGADAKMWIIKKKKALLSSG